MNSFIKNFAVFCGVAFFSFSGYSQKDTLHLNYHHTQIKPHDTTVARIDQWVKKLNGKHVDIRVIAYYHKLEFKKYSDQRLEELFLILNRKARSLITIVEQDSKKGKDYQRTMVDIVYTPSLTEAEKKAKAEAEAAEAKKVADAKKAAAAEKSAKEKEEKAAKEAAKSADGKGGEEKAAKAGGKGKDKKGGKGKEGDAEQLSQEEEAKAAEKEKKGKKGNSYDLGNYGQSTKVNFDDGYKLTLEEVKWIKRAKVIVSEASIGEVNDDLYKAVQEFWDFNTNITRMPYEEALKMGKANKKDTIVIISFMQVFQVFSQKFGPVSRPVPFAGYAVGIENNKGKTLVKQFITKESGKHPSPENLSFGISVLNDICHTMLDNNISKWSKADPFYDLRTPELKNKTLLIPEFMLHPKLPPQDIPQYYTSKYKIASDKEWKDAILNKADVAYTMIVMLPRPAMDGSGEKDYVKYALDAKTGRVLFIDAATASGMAPGIAGVRVDMSNSGYFDKANFQKFEKGILRAEVDNANRADKKASKEEKEKEKAIKKEKEEELKKAKAKEKEEKEAAKKKEKESGKKSEESSTGASSSNEVEKELNEGVKEEEGKKKKEEKKSKSKKKDEEEKKEETKSE